MRLDMPEPIHRTTCRVLYGDTDAGGVVYYGTYLRYLERGRTEFMRGLGIPYRLIQERGLILPVIECYTRYKASAVYDDLLSIQTALAEVKKFSCTFHYRILRQEAGQNNAQTLLVKGSTTHASVNVNGKLAPLPDDVLKILQSIRSGVAQK